MKKIFKNRSWNIVYERNLQKLELKYRTSNFGRFLRYLWEHQIYYSLTLVSSLNFRRVNCYRECNWRLRRQLQLYRHFLKKKKIVPNIIWASGLLHYKKKYSKGQLVIFFVSREHIITLKSFYKSQK